MILVRHVILVLMLLPLGLVSGCGDVRRLAQDLDGSADGTFWFWGRLQGIQYRGNRKIKSQSVANVANAKSYDLDAVAKGYSDVALQHDHMAQQLSDLDGEKADEIAVNYRDRLVAVHRNLRDRYRVCAESTKQRQESGIVNCKAELDTLLTDYVQLWNEKDAVMSKLKDKFDRDFNCME